MSQLILLSVANNIATITINRPEKLNALNKHVIDSLSDTLDNVLQDTTVKSIILTGSGIKAFVAGADISEFTGLNKEQGTLLAQRGQELVFNKIEQASKPIIAAVNGFALGGGCELAMACHFRVAAEHAKFGQPEVNLGLIPGYGGTQRLVQLIGKGRALELLLTGNMIDAATAHHYGLVNHVVPADALLEKASQLLQIINKKAPLAISGCIAASNAVYREDINGFEKEITLFGQLIATNDAKEGATAFAEKRPAVFTGQ